MVRSRRLALAACLPLAAAAALPFAASGDTQRDKARVKAPKRGQYVGQTRERREATLLIARRRIKQAVFEADCGLGPGRVSVRRVKLRRTKRGFRFSVRRHPRINYDDGHAPQVATLVASGRFNRRGRKVRGLVRIRSRHCGNTGKLRWSARYTSPPVKVPKEGTYSGRTKQARRVDLYTSGRNVRLFSVEIKCRRTTGRTSLNDIDMRRTYGGYKFVLRAHGSVTYDDGHPDQNGAVDVTGRFNRAGTKAVGRVRAKTPYCGGTGQVPWSAKRLRTG